MKSRNGAEPAGSPRRPLPRIRVFDEVDFAPESSNEMRVEWLLQPGKEVVVSRPTAALESVVLLQRRAGSLWVQALALPDTNAPSFVVRPPTAQHLDMPQEAVRTLTRIESGASRSIFAVLLVPGTAVGIEAHIESWKPGQRRVVVRGPGFQDSLP